MKDCKEEQVLAETMGGLQGIGEGEEIAKGQHDEEAAPQQIKRTFAQVLKEQSYKTLRQEKEQQRKEKAAMVAQKEQQKQKKAAVNRVSVFGC